MTIRTLLAATTALGLTLPAAALAQDNTPPSNPQDEGVSDPNDVGEGDVIVVTAVARGANVLESSVSVSSIGAESIADLAPRSSAELIRQIPGIRSESSGGEGNANIAVRGLPVASGGAKFLQLQEDGLPILEFGDITFGNADIFLRTDYNVARVEAVRGGSASTFASNSPGGVVNFISKTGRGGDGGSIGATVGLDYDEKRIDFDYGGAIGADTYFHVGGFYREGEGPREIGYNGYRGGQIKANVTQEFSGGYVRAYFKYLDDRSPGYLPNPVLVTGSDGDPTYTDITNFDINNDSLHSEFFQTATTLNGSNNPQTYDIDQGMHPEVVAVGLEAEFELGGGWSIIDRFRYADIGGEFVSPFPGSVVDATSAAEGVGGPGAMLFYATGPNAGSMVSDPTTLGGNGLIANIVLFNTQLNSLDNITNDLRINGSFDIGEGSSLDLTGGLYYSNQTVDTDWLWTSHLMSVQGGGEAVLLDVQDAMGNPVTQDGTVAFGASFFGYCCRRSYDVDYETVAPFLSATFMTGDLTLDGSLRYDFGNAEGSVSGADLGGGRVGVTSFDFDGNGVIDPAEAQTSIIPLDSPAPVDYDYDYMSYSIGANYLLGNDASVFARWSHGGRANADRILFNPNNVSLTDGSLLSDEVAIDFVDQFELGVKYRRDGLSVYATGFYAETEEQNFEATTQTVFDRSYTAWGVELEGAYRSGPFSLSAGATYTDAEISRDSISPANEGNTPRRQADFVYQGTIEYDAEIAVFGLNAVGTTDSFAQDSNQLVLPGFTQVNAYVNVRPIDNVELSLNANNLFNVNGFTEAEEGSIPGNGIVRARSINGRTISASLRFDF